MYRISIAYAATLIAYLVVDGVVIFSFGAKVYKNTLGDVIADSFHIRPIVLFYLLFTFGLCYFAVLPALDDGRWQTAALRGALYGLCAYGTYSLTCYSAIRNWTLQLAAMDLCGGTVIAAVVATSALLVATRA
jgi:uncharacterized membrane protein